jgi:tRNA (guanine37-N1)-methyltransferase
MIQFEIITLFPEVLKTYLNFGILKNAILNKKVRFKFHDIRKYSDNKNSVDDYSFGSSYGMILKPEPIFRIFNKIYLKNKKFFSIYLTSNGKILNEEILSKYRKNKRIVLLSGHYSGIDQRIIDKYINEEISIGDYILTNGILAVGVFIDSFLRLVPGVIKNKKSLEENCISEKNLLSFPHYTRPKKYLEYYVPSILLSGNHRRIEEWKKQESIKKTKKFRPDLYSKYKKRFKK